MKTLELANKTISTKLPAFVMGILNITPDSFWQASCGDVVSAMKIIDAGADIIDIGGESTRPGASYISEQEELIHYHLLKQKYHLKYQPLLQKQLS